MLASPFGMAYTSGHLLKQYIITSTHRFPVLLAGEGPATSNAIPVLHCLLISNPIKRSFSLSSIFVTPRRPPLAPLWNSINISFILEEGTANRLDEVLPSVVSFSSTFTQCLRSKLQGRLEEISTFSYFMPLRFLNGNSSRSSF